MNNSVLKEQVNKHNKISLFNTNEVNLPPNVAIAKITENLFKELKGRYPNDLIETS